MTLPANCGLVQRTPAASVHVDKGLENQRVRTSASTPALVPLLAVLIAALPVPAHENFRFFNSSHQFLSFQVGSGNENCVEIGRGNAVLGMFTPSCHVALEDIHHTIGNFEFAFLASVFASSSFNVMTKGVVAFLATPATKTARVPKKFDFHRIRYRLEKGRDNH